MALQQIKKYWIDSFLENPTVFWIEMLATISVAIGSFLIAYTVLSLEPILFIPFYLFGSICSLIAAIIRRAVWVIVMTSWFTAMNVAGLSRLILGY
mgnify:FL=1|jgi:hypothetical protein